MPIDRSVPPTMEGDAFHDGHRIHAHKRSHTAVTVDEMGRQEFVKTIDAPAVARAALPEPDLAIARLDGVERGTRLLVDHREDLVAERTNGGARSHQRLRTCRGNSRSGFHQARLARLAIKGRQSEGVYEECGCPMLRFALPGFVILTLVLIVGRAVRDYGAAAEAVDARMRENDADNLIVAPWASS
jgi:hypothetical protein